MKTASAHVVARIEALCVLRDLAPHTVGRRASIGRLRMDRIMNQLCSPTSGELIQIADVIDVPVLVLLGKVDPRVGLAAQLRCARRAAELDRPFRRLETLLAIRELVDRFEPRPQAEATPSVPASDAYRFDDQGQQTALHLREVLGLGARPVGDLEHLVGRFGLDVCTEPLPRNLHGLLVTSGTSTSTSASTPNSQVPLPAAVTLLNADDTTGRRRFTLAHQLAHLLFADARLAVADYRDRDAATVDRRWTTAKLTELRADTFAQHLLAPDIGVRAVTSRLNERDTHASWALRLVVQICLQFRVDLASAARRAHDLGFLTDVEQAQIGAHGAHRAFAQAGREKDCGDLLDTAMGVSPPHLLLSQTLAAYRHEVVGLNPLTSLYDECRQVQVARTSVAGRHARQRA